MHLQTTIPVFVVTTDGATVLKGSSCVGCIEVAAIGCITSSMVNAASLQTILTGTVIVMNKM
jgi:hypothetical protein